MSIVAIATLYWSMGLLFLSSTHDDALIVLSVGATASDVIDKTVSLVTFVTVIVLIIPYLYFVTSFALGFTPLFRLIEITKYQRHGHCLAVCQSSLKR